MDFTFMDFDRFIENYKYKPVKEFGLDGTAATWASSTDGRTKTWGEEDARLALPPIIPQREFTLGSLAAVSFDERFIAVASNVVVKIYEIASLRETSTITVDQDSVASLSITAWCGASTVSGEGRTASAEPTYTLLLEGCEDSDARGRIFVWALDCYGRLLDVALSPGIERNANANATEAFAWMDAAMTNSNGQGTRPLIIIDGDLNCRSPDFLDSSGKNLIYVEENSSAATEVVIFSLATNFERYRLQGHSDKVMWASWSPDGKTAATASWDQTCKLWDAETGQCRHTIGPTGGQNWHGEFSPSGNYIFFTGGGPENAAVYSTTDGREVARLELPEDQTYLCWSPRDDAELAVGGGTSVKLWWPLEDRSEEIFKLDRNGVMLDSFCQISPEWFDGGDKFAVKTSDNTIALWDRKRNVKWRFQKSTSLSLTESSDAMFYLASTGTLVSLDCDRVVRFWKL